MNARDLSPITFGVILPPKLRGKNSTNSQIDHTALDENKNSKVCTIKILLDCDVSTLIARREVLYERHRIHKDKGQPWQGPLIILL